MGAKGNKMYEKSRKPSLKRYDIRPESKNLREGKSNTIGNSNHMDKSKVLQLRKEI